jgi:hypothetical protein
VERQDTTKRGSVPRRRALVDSFARNEGVSKEGVAPKIRQKTFRHTKTYKQTQLTLRIGSARLLCRSRVYAAPPRPRNGHEKRGGAIAPQNRVGPLWNAANEVVPFTDLAVARSVKHKGPWEARQGIASASYARHPLCHRRVKVDVGHGVRWDLQSGRARDKRHVTPLKRTRARTTTSEASRRRGHESGDWKRRRQRHVCDVAHGLAVDARDFTRFPPRK